MPDPKDPTETERIVALALPEAIRGFDDSTYGQVDIHPTHMAAALRHAMPIILAAVRATDPGARHA